MAYKTRCKVCGVEYEVCASCKHEASWRLHTDTAEHYQILCALMEFKARGDAKKAYDICKRCGVDFENTGGYNDSVSALLQKIAELLGENSSAGNSESQTDNLSETETEARSVKKFASKSGKTKYKKEG